MSQRSSAGIARRPRVTPPHVSLAAIRVGRGMTIDAVCACSAMVRPERPITRGTLAGIENGLRGASQQTLALLEKIYDLPAGSVTTTYEPRPRKVTASGSTKS